MEPCISCITKGGCLRPDCPNAGEFIVDGDGCGGTYYCNCKRRAELGITPLYKKE